MSMNLQNIITRDEKWIRDIILKSRQIQNIVEIYVKNTFRILNMTKYIEWYNTLNYYITFNSLAPFSFSL